MSTKHYRAKIRTVAAKLCKSMNNTLP